jgi:hypothetical protein
MNPENARLVILPPSCERRVVEDPVAGAREERVFAGEDARAVVAWVGEAPGTKTWRVYVAVGTWCRLRSVLDRGITATVHAPGVANVIAPPPVL